IRVPRVGPKPCGPAGGNPARVGSNPWHPDSGGDHRDVSIKELLDPRESVVGDVGNLDERRRSSAQPEVFEYEDPEGRIGVAARSRDPRGMGEASPEDG